MGIYPVLNFGSGEQPQYSKSHYGRYGTDKIKADTHSHANGGNHPDRGSRGKPDYSAATIMDDSTRPEETNAQHHTGGNPCDIGLLAESIN
jgi:hypothetical protein